MLTITPESRTTVYNGQEQSVAGAEYAWADDQGQPLSGYTVSGVTYGAAGTDAGTYPVARSGDLRILDAGGNDVTAQFAVQEGQASLVISRRSVTITAGSENFDYDGDAHSLNESSVTAGSLADGHTYTAVVTGSVREQNETAANVISDIRIFDAGGTEVTANYEITPENGELSINAIGAKIQAVIRIADKTTVYNGAEQRFTDLQGEDFTFEFVGAEDYDTSKWTISGTAISTARTNAGEYVVRFDDRSSLQVLDGDGNPVQSASISVENGSLVIRKAELTLTASSAEKEYDGTPLTSEDYYSDGLQGADVIASLTVEGSQLAPGSSSNRILADSVAVQNASGSSVNDNYEIQFKDGTLTVTNEEKDSRVITVTAHPASKVYDGTPLTAAENAQITGNFANGDAVDRTRVQINGSQTFVGTSANKVDPSTVHVMNNGVEVTEAYTIKTVDAELTVTQRPLTLTADSGSKVYDGTPLTAPGVAATGTLADTDQFETEPTAVGSRTEAGQSANPVSQVKIIDRQSGEDRTDNYKITAIAGLLTVTKAPADQNAVSLEDKLLIYDGEAHSLDAGQAAVTEGTTLTYTTDPDGGNWSSELPEFTDVGRYPVYVKAENPNYEDSYGSGVLTISRRPVVITGNGTIVTYNGDIQTVSGYTVSMAEAGSASGLLAGHSVSGVTAEASYKNIGSRIPGTITDPADVKITAGSLDVTGNYDIVTEPGWITIFPRNIRVESVSEEKLYDGKLLTADEAAVTEGDLAEGDTVLYSFTGGQMLVGSSENTVAVTIWDGEENVTNNYLIQYTYGTLTVYGEITYDANGGAGAAPAPDRYDQGDTYTVRNNMFTRAGYTFTGWNTRADGQGTAYAEGNAITSLSRNLTLYAQWSANADTEYKVETYLEGEDGTYPAEPTTSETRTAETDTLVSVTEADKTAPEGYALDPAAGNVFEGTVAGDGSLVLKLYFAKDVKGGGDDGEDPDDIPDKYQVIFRYKAEGSGTVTGTVVETHTYTDAEGGYVLPYPIVPEADVTAVPDMGHDISGWTDEADQDLGTGAAPAFGELAYDTDQTFTVRFEPSEDTAYRVEFYYGDENGNYPDTPQDVQERQGTTGAQVSVTDADRQPAEGYVLDEAAPNIYEGTVAADGSLVLKLYFAKDVKGGGDDGEDPDGIPDCYQLIFRYVAEENGSVSGTVTEVHTFRDENGNYTKPEPTVPDADVEAAADEGYVIDVWADEDGNTFGNQSVPAITRAYGEDMTFTVTFKAEEKTEVPEEKPDTDDTDDKDDKGDKETKEPAQAVKAPGNRRQNRDRILDSAGGCFSGRRNGTWNCKTEKKQNGGINSSSGSGSDNERRPLRD